MSEYLDRVCDECEEKETCESYKFGIKNGLIPFGCSVRKTITVDDKENKNE